MPTTLSNHVAEDEVEAAAFSGGGCWGSHIIRGPEGFHQGQEIKRCLVKRVAVWKVVGNRS